MDLQSSLALTYLFITHDLAMAAHLAGKIAVMEPCRIAELGDQYCVAPHRSRKSPAGYSPAVPKPFSASQTCR